MAVTKSMDWMIQSVIFVLVFISLFGVVNANADGKQFFMRYYAVDVGLLVDSLHGAKGTLELPYAKLFPTHEYDFDFTENAVRLRPTPQQPGMWDRVTGATSVEPLWVLRRRYASSASVSVEPKTIQNPGLLMLMRERNAIEVSGDAGSFHNCPEYQGVAVLLAGDSPLLTAEARQILNSYTTGTEVALSVQEGTPNIIARGPAAQALACQLSLSLPGYPITYGDGPDVLSFTHDPGLQQERLIGLFVRSLEVLNE